MIITKIIDAVVLCGGLGTRLREKIGETQKVMAQIKDRPFLDILLKYLRNQGVRRVIMCVGYKKEEVTEYYKNKNMGLELVYSKEKEPLGTGGAIKYARNYIKSDPFVVLNGDSYCAIDIAEFLIFHQQQKALASIVVARVSNSQGFGRVILDKDKRIIAFIELPSSNQNSLTGVGKEKLNKEKNNSSVGGLANAGMYVFNKKIFSFMPEKDHFSLEYDVFPQLTHHGLHGFRVNETFIDIGTPQRLEKIRRMFKRNV